MLANEQVTEGECWRCHSAVEKRDLTQWYLKITDYAQELLDLSLIHLLSVYDLNRGRITYRFK